MLALLFWDDGRTWTGEGGHHVLVFNTCFEDLMWGMGHALFFRFELLLGRGGVVSPEDRCRTYLDVFVYVGQRVQCGERGQRGKGTVQQNTAAMCGIYMYIYVYIYICTYTYMHI